MKAIKTTLLLLASSLLSISGFGQTLEFTDEASFLAALGDAEFTKETFDECVGNSEQPYPGGDFSISHSGNGEGRCNDFCHGGDGFAYAWNNQVKLTFPAPKNAFGTYLLDVGTGNAAVTVMLMTDDGQSYEALVNIQTDERCTSRFFGIISDMDFTMAEFTTNTDRDFLYLEDTYCASDVSVRAIPTLSQWRIIALSIIMLILGLVVVKQRKVIFG